MENDAERRAGSGLRKIYPDKVEKARILTGPYASRPGDPFGMFMFVNYVKNVHIKVMVGDGLDWDHVSVSTPNRCPTWEEMKTVRELFFEDDCWVIEYHPPTAMNINNHSFCLHMWHKQGGSIEVPPADTV